jgi:hypothetical protein
MTFDGPSHPAEQPSRDWRLPQKYCITLLPNELGPGEADEVLPCCRFLGCFFQS